MLNTGKTTGEANTIYLFIFHKYIEDILKKKNMLQIAKLSIIKRRSYYYTSMNEYDLLWSRTSLGFYCRYNLI